MSLKGRTRVPQITAPSHWINGVSAAASALTVTVAANVPATGGSDPQVVQNALAPSQVGVQLQTLITGVVASCSVAASGVIQLTITDGVNTYEIDVSLTAGTPLNVPLPGTFAAQLGNAVTVSTTAGASTSVVKLSVAYDYL